MSGIAFSRKNAKLNRLLGIRGRLVVMALILVAPLMFDRIRVLENTRAKQIADAKVELSEYARNGAAAQREIISSIEALLKSSAYIHVAATEQGRGCAIMRASLRVDLPWILSLSVVNRNGIVQCSTLSALVGQNLSDRAYFKKVLETHEFVLSDLVLGKLLKIPTVVAAYPTTAFDAGEPAVMIATVNLKWMAQIIGNYDHRPGVQALLVDSEGSVLAVRPDNPDLIGKPMPDRSLLDRISTQDKGSIIYESSEGDPEAVSFARINGTGLRLIVSADYATMLAGIKQDIKTAYVQLGIVVLLALLGAWLAGERLIIGPIRMMTAMTQRLGQGDLAARATNARVPAEFAPLATAFDAMAVRLAEREGELVASNDRLTVMASIDLISGLANRRGFQSRFDFEWLRAQQDNGSVALLMIDVDHFKLFNDSYGHPEGDACLGRVGETLARIANETAGFAARYGGEEFCLLLPRIDMARATEIGELVRASVEELAVPHSTSIHRRVTVSVGVARSLPDETGHPTDLIEAADAALYAAKRRGRNTVVGHGLIRAQDTVIARAS